MYTLHVVLPEHLVNVRITFVDFITLLVHIHKYMCMYT